MSDFFNWDDEVTSEGSEFVTLLPGKYTATVTKIEKSRWDRVGDLNGCPYAAITLACEGNGQKGNVFVNLFLSRKTEFIIANFLKAFGLKKKDEPVKASRIEKALHKKCIVTVACTLDKEHNYKKLNAEEAKRAIENGEVVYNNIKAYEPLEEEPAAESFGGFSGEEFGF